MKEKTKYGNWVPEKMLAALWALVLIAAVLLGLSIGLWHSTLWTVIFAIGLVVALFYAIYMSMFHQAFSFSGGGLMGKMHDYLLTKLPFSGKGKILDIGCGSGALIISAAKKFPEAQCMGIDYWGASWNYAKEQCESNAKIEGVSNVEFQKGDAAALNFNDGEFDAAISNFVFHEVRSVSDKHSLVKEALRVVKKGGAFCFQDMFEVKRLYGSMDEFIKEIRSWGVSEIHYEPHTENLPFVPKSIKLMFKDMGMIYGIK